mmetsp:Transcript_15510/g.22884  ORF Transcript_15510/g.22884 Transcript_15510/m.22884 type:complete len:172 (+) Transcript_15510:50-565(+)
MAIVSNTLIMKRVVFLSFFHIISAFHLSISTFSWRSPRLFASVIEYQENCGRGEQHLSAYLDDGDLVVYQSGTWLVDGVKVGDGSDPYLMYALIDSIQLVWTHNCEHGLLRGFEIEMDESGREVKLVDPLTELQFGPEQLIAKIPIDWNESDNSGKIICEPIQEDMWTPLL